MASPRIDTLHEIGITIISSWIFNCYVVHDGGDGRPFVVDPGMVRNSEAALEHLDRSLGIDLAAQRVGGESFTVAATHAHSDHVAGVPHLCDHAAMALYLPATTRDWTDGTKPRTPGMKAAARIAPVLRDQPFDLESLRGFVGEAKAAGYGAQPYRMPVAPAGFLADEDPVPGAPDWVALHTPGHTDESTSYWCPSTRTLLSGDAVLGIGRHAWFNPEFVDDELAAATEKRLRSLDVEFLLPGHGRACAGKDVTGVAFGHLETPPGDHGPLRRLFRRHRS